MGSTLAVHTNVCFGSKADIPVMSDLGGKRTLAMGYVETPSHSVRHNLV